MTDTLTPEQQKERAVAFLEKWSKSYDLKSQLMKVFGDREIYESFIPYTDVVEAPEALGSEAQKYVGQFYLRKPE